MSQPGNSIESDDEISDELKHLLNRDTQSLNFPDAIYALGGGGRKMVLEMFDQDWVIVEALRDNSSTIDITFIDSATENEENHADEVEALRSKKNELSQLLQTETPPGTSVGSINIEEQIITEGLQITNRADLTGERTVDRIKNREPTVDHWWLQREHLNTTGAGTGFYDISKGAVKRRALGKALHYKALAEGSANDYRASLNTRTGQDDDIAVFVGLGGGTGSGTFIDIINEIDDQNEKAGISVFATLPASTQRDEARANAFAALSELEYLQLEGEPPFRNVFLFPLEPTGLEGEATDLPELNELDRVMTYGVLGVYNSPNRDYALDKPSYAPFTIVVPQVLQYSKDKIRERKKEIHKIFNIKSDLLNIEYENISEIEAYLDDRYSGIHPADASDLTTASRDYLKTRLGRLERLVTSDVINNLDINIPDDFETTLTDAIYDDLDQDANSVEDAVQRRSLSNIIEDLEFVISDFDIDRGLVDNYINFDSDYVQDVVETEIVRLYDVFTLLKRLRGAEINSAGGPASTKSTDADTKLLKTFVLAPRELEQGSRRSRWRSLNNALEDAKEKEEAKKQEINEKSREIEKEQGEYSQTFEQGRNAFISSAGDSLDEFVALRNTNYRSKLNEVRRQLDNFADTHSEGVVGNDTTQGDVDAALTDLEETLNDENLPESIDISETASNIRDSLSAVQQAKIEWDEIEEEIEDDGWIFGGIFKDDETDTLDTSAYDEARRTVEQKSVFSLPRPPHTPDSYERQTFTVDLVLEVESEVNSEIEDAEEVAEKNLSEAFNEALETVEQDQRENDNNGIGDSASPANGGTRFDFRGKLENNDHSKEAITGLVESGIRSTLDTNTDQLKRERQQLEQEKSAIEDQKARLLAAKELFDERTSAIRTGYENGFQDTYDTYDDKFRPRMFERIPGRQGASNDIEGLYEQEVEPSNLTSVVEQPSLSESELLKNERGDPSQERENIRRMVTQIAERKVTDSQYHGLEHETFSEEGIGGFENARLYVSFLSEALDSGGDSEAKLHPGDFAVQDSLTGSFGVSDPGNNYEEGHVENSHPWEVGMCVYIQGSSFLDNLRNVQMNKGGFLRVYQRLKQNHGEQTILARHALHLEKGHYHVREDLNDLRSDASLFLENESAVRDTLLQRHEKHDITQQSTN